MRLTSFRVTQFRSVVDSGWIDVTDVTALIGTNESGKTNLLVPLWKLNPATKDGEIVPLADYPRKDYGPIRDEDPKPIFIRARFELAAEEQVVVAALANAAPEEIAVAEVARRFDGQYIVGFPQERVQRPMAASVVRELLASSRSQVEAVPGSGKLDSDYRDRVRGALDAALSALVGDEVTGDRLAALLEKLPSADGEDVPKRSTIAPLVAVLREQLGGHLATLTRQRPSSILAARNKVRDMLPKFVYYTNYGNLDSAIYLPHVIDNFGRNDLGPKDSAKVRTLRVLFKYVGLEPQEILDLGHDAVADARRSGRSVTSEMIEQVQAKKTERSVLLQSASSRLTKDFREWWLQGNYVFRFEADGDHFRIWVSDEMRPEEIELESRSTGLQWFFSFYLVFCAESDASHANAVLLLDEPGLTLHPLAQRDLTGFFESLAEDNQIIYTTHSPFLVDADHLDRVKAVYVRPDGSTGVSSDLRASETKEGKDKSQSRSIYPVYAALGLSVSSTLLEGCLPVIVEGQSDVHLLSAIKNVLIGLGRLQPTREIVFVPSGGTRGVAAVSAILAAKAEDLPPVLLDDDSNGRRLLESLKSGTYQGAGERLHSVAGCVGLAGAEVEDLIPAGLYAKAVDRYLRADEDFADALADAQPLVPQIERFAEKQGISLPVGWKVEVAKRVKEQMLRRPEDVPAATLDVWTKVFRTLIGAAAEVGS